MDPTATFPGWGPKLYFARTYDLKSFKDRILDRIPSNFEVLIFIYIVREHAFSRISICILSAKIKYENEIPINKKTILIVMKILNFFMHQLFPAAAGNQANTLELCNVLKKRNITAH